MASREYYYVFFGLHLSSDMPLKGLDNRDRPPEIDVEIQFNPKKLSIQPTNQYTHQPYYTSPYFNSNGHPLVMAWRGMDDGDYCLIDSNHVKYTVTSTGSRILVQPPPLLTLNKVVDNLLYFVLVFVLRLRGFLCFYAAVVASEGSAFAFVGYSYSGKSMLTAALAARGISVLSDDLLVLNKLDRSFVAQSGYPWICLRPMALKGTFKQLDECPRLSAEWEYHGDRYVSLDLRQNGFNFEDRSLSLKAVYFIDARSDDPARPSIKPMSAQEAMVELLSHSWNSPVLDKKMTRHDFNHLGQLADFVTFRRLQPHTDTGGMPRLCTLVLRDIDKLSSTTNTAFE